MYCAVIKLANRKDRGANKDQMLIPGGKAGVWIAGSLGLLVVVAGIVLSLIPPAESTNKWMFETKLVAGTVLSVVLGLVLYLRGARQKARELSSSAGSSSPR
jgi:4-amino-4-deoxy-L-arabinose transferase-like glycosyltransferase